MPVLKPEALFLSRVSAIRREHERLGIARAELDLSGGIDSAVMAGILVAALGAENVTLVHSRFSTAGAQSKRAKMLARGLGAKLLDFEGQNLFDDFVQLLMDTLHAAGYDCDEIDARIDADPTILGSIRSTLRAPIGRAFNRLTGGGLRYGTGNEDEDRWLRFYQKGGDGEVDNNPLAFLSKGEVYQLAVYLKKVFPAAAEVYDATIRATPSPDLWGTGDGHSDEAELLALAGVPFTYSRVDPETGEYTYVGSIERISRFLDNHVSRDEEDVTIEDILFDRNEKPDWMRLEAYGHTAWDFDGCDFKEGELINWLKAARKIEAQTRHKMNPNCPTYGNRWELIKSGIITNDLPVLPSN